ncbi:MAG: heavy metal sensor histidine kinase [Pseudomonadota bacterium]
MNLLRHMSLATWLAMFFAAATALVFSVAGAHLYLSMSQQLQLRDDVLLLNTISFLRHRLGMPDGLEMARLHPDRLLDVVLGQKGLLLAIKGPREELLAASARDAMQLSTDTPVPEDLNPDAAAIRDWHGSEGKRGRMIAAWARTGQEPDDRVQLIVVREDTESAIVLREHRNHVLLAVLTGVLATALLGYVIARGGLRSVRVVAQAAGEITANQLGGRLQVEDTPAELEDMVRAFNQMLDRLEDSFRRLTQFSSDIAHDLRTPIGNLMIETQVALTKQRSIPEYEALLASNIEEYERLTRMLENMMFLARADNAQVALHEDTISAGLELKRIAEYFEGMANETGVTLDVEASGVLVADAVLFRRAVSNLIANALRHTPGGQHVTILGNEQEPRQFVVAVSNPGSGIPAEHLPRIFDRFYRVDNARGGSQSSFGLGLAIVKSIMTLHRGKAQVESVPNGLTTFTLVFPKG